MQRKPKVKYSYNCGYDVTYAEFKTLQLYNIMKSDQNDTKFCTRLFMHKVNKICHKTKVEVLASRPL